ncbi:ribosome small subunit-dependent GTPase A [Christensenella sp. NSJ-35]|uniref:Small ribosomal subunit biogenesis GTPase RsgA n=2 Tax=Christensenella tenuis TaxID=2763033 RepID=A0ABR7EBE7_9FIRM|nr:ribosome small subunit-dependent GTPase A [Christensenella tenuis]
MKPMVGDLVDFADLSGYSSIEEILPRKNAMKRPAVANLDRMLLVLSAGKPMPDLLLADKLLIQAKQSGIHPVIVINKTDMDFQYAQELEKQYAYYDTILTSAKDHEGIDLLEEKIRGKCVCLAGQSAVGKSSLINRLDESFGLETGGLSKKTDRGKHTTRQAELFYVENCDAYVVDTPGFSMFEMNLNKDEIAGYYPEFCTFGKQCRFISCLHDREPDCGVKQAVETGEINRERYERYLRIIHSLEEK